MALVKCEVCHVLGEAFERCRYCLMLEQCKAMTAPGPGKAIQDKVDEQVFEAITGTKLEQKPPAGAGE